MNCEVYLDGYGYPSGQAFYRKIEGPMLVVVLIHSADDLSTNSALPAITSHVASL